MTREACRGVAEAGEDRETVHGWEHEIEDHEIRSAGVEPSQRGGAVGHARHPVAVALQIAGDHLADHRFVVDDQDMPT
jgi:hypothetical protein